jgi:DNA-binding MarR family transcriptional regulator
MMRDRSRSVKALSAAEVRGEDVDVLFMVWLVSRATEDLLDQVLAPAGLTGDEFAIYSMLSSSRTITPTELSRWMAAPATTVSSYVKRFEARGHVVREKNPEDGRSYRLRLTSSGRKVHREAASRFGPVRARAGRDLGDDAPRVRDALLQLREVVDAIRGQAQTHR